MSVNTTPLLAMIEGRLKHLSARQRLIAQNVANADTAGFTPRDLRPFSAAQPARSIGPAVTHAAHIGAASRGGTGSFKSFAAPGSETTLDGNSVVLEEEMIKLAESRSDYDAAISLYQKSMGLLRLASRAPGR